MKCMPGIVRQFGAKIQGDRSGASALLQGVAKLTFMTGIAAGILLAWQGITLQVQMFSVRPDSFTSWMQHAWTAAVRSIEAPLPRTTFGQEQQMSASQLINRWTPVITEASARFNVPATWIRAVVQMESGGRTMIGENRPIVSHAGAMGLMQLMPGTYKLMRAQFKLGANPFNARDNIYAGAAYLHQLYQHYGYPAMFAAYNDGPGHLDDRLGRGRLLPLETRNYVKRIVTALTGGSAKDANPAALQDGTTAKFTRPNGTPVAVKLADITAVRVPFRGEYPAGVNAVVTEGKVSQAVRETYDTVKAAMLEHGALGQPASGQASRFAALLAPNLIAARSPAGSKDRRHEQHRHVAEHHRAHAEFRLADGAIRLHPVSHHSHS
ncbi:MAG TPA: lytic transglycosylase domain-containing protein [Rhizomicrobium sp.]|jgi:membrane-bound lytic murein transglycosylase B|nr:lytic transglycosylase domain-containing protein [Rhizomicrobium sp.]